MENTIKEIIKTAIDLIEKEYLTYCKEHNGLPYCKNCGLSRESLEKLLKVK